MCLDCEVNDALWAEATRRTEIDGIPRFVTSEGKIMKRDWEFPEGCTPELTGEALEAHIERLLKEQSE